MFSRDTRGIETRQINRENIIENKGKQTIRFNVPQRRPALGDVSNKIPTRAMRDLKQPTLKVDSSRIDKFISNIDKVQTKQLPTRQIPTKLIKREESLVISRVSSFSSNQLNIYDPDENTKNDPTAVTEYLEDIFSHMREIEAKYKIEANYLKNHKTTPGMRAVLVDWMADLQINFKFCLETLHLGVCITDRYLQANRTVGRETLQLVGATALMVSAKYEEVCTPDIRDYEYVCDDAFSVKQILDMEKCIIKAIDFFLNRPTSILFLRRYSKIAQVSSLQHNLGKYLLELALLDYSLCQVLPSHQAAAACCLSVAILNEEMDLSKVWSPTLVHYTTYKLSDFKHVIILLARLLSKIDQSKQQTIVKKYKASSYGKISTNAKLKGRLVMKLVAEKHAQLSDST